VAETTRKPSGVYRIREFATRAGVTVRALHHYDRLGLLKPSGRSAGGYRLYRDCDFARLEQIVVLKFLGLSLKEIAQILKRESPLPDTLRRQRQVLTETRRRLDMAIHAIEQAERSVRSRTGPDWDLFTLIVREIEMQDTTDWTKQYYTPEARAKVEARKTLWSPELQARVTTQWTELVADVEAALGEDPAGPRAQALAARWRALVEGFTGGDREIQKGLNRMWNDTANWPAEERARFHIDPRVQEFVLEAMNATRR
jgi:MerR family transcriptional regulator, thiopeptide resistance regulator